MQKLILAVLAVALCGSAAYANGNSKRVQQSPQVVYVQPQPEPLRQIPIVGTVVYGGLNYAGALILSPTELITGTPRR